MPYIAFIKLHVCNILKHVLIPRGELYNHFLGSSIPLFCGRPHICHGYHGLYLWRKICHVEKFQISVKNLNNLWSFIEIYAVFVLNLCGEKSVWRKSLWRKNDKYEVWTSLQKGFIKMTNIA